MNSPTSPVERNLLFGILALQNNLIDRAALLDGFNRWVEAKERPVGEILVECGALAADERVLMDALVDKHLEKFRGDPLKSLEVLSSIDSVREELLRIGDIDVDATLTRVSAARRNINDAFDTIVPSGVGTSSSVGARFRILRFHAKGGLGQVSVALDQELDRQVALKEIKDQLADDRASRARFVQEAEITGKLEHPGIIPVYGLGHDITGRPFYAMRFIKGDSLKEAIARFHAEREKKPDRAERLADLRSLVRRFTDVCNAIAYAHSRGVLHRDLKPGNVMLGPYGETLVVDWGLAKVLNPTVIDEANPADASSSPSTIGSEPIHLSGQSSSGVETVAGSAIGTPAYSSPEQIAGQLDALGPASDVYGLGATLYALLTGRAPIEIEEVRADLAKQRDKDHGHDSQADDEGQMILAEISRRVKAGMIRSPRSVDPTVPKPVEAICKKAMALKPEDRYPSARALAKEVERWLDDLPVSAYREPLAVRAWRWVRRHRTTAAAAFSALIVAGVGLGIAAWMVQKAEQAAQKQTQDLSVRILTVEVDSVHSIVGSLGPLMARVKSSLADRWRGPDLDPEGKLRVALALGSAQPDVRSYLEDRLLNSDPRTVRVIAECLKTDDAPGAARRFWAIVEDPNAPASRHFRAACALAILDPPDGAASEERWIPQSDAVVREALGIEIFPGDELDRTLSPLGRLFLRAVGRYCHEGNPHRRTAFGLLRHHAARTNQPDLFFSQARPAALILDAEPDDFEWLLSSLEFDRKRAIASLKLAAADPDVLFDDEPAMKGHETAHRQARALIALVRLGNPEALSTALLSNDPSLRTWLSRDLGRLRVEPKILAAQLRAEADPSKRTALIIALGSYAPRKIDESTRRELEAILVGWYRDDPHPGLHGAITWLLKTRWGLEKTLHDIDQTIHSRDAAPGRLWYVNNQGQTFAVISNPQKFLMGSPKDDKDHADNEGLHERQIPRSFAIATTEVTVAQYREFVRANKVIFQDAPPFEARVSPDDDCPVHGVSWFEAILYCRWLSDREKIPEDQMCFPPMDALFKSITQARLDMSAARLVQKRGYRLPSEAEWEFACRAGTTSPRFFGHSASLLGDYARFAGNSGVANLAEAESQGRTSRVGWFKPNDLGLFDIYGNVREWCLDAYKPYPLGNGPGLAIVVDTAFEDPVAAGDLVRSARGGSFADPAGWTRSAYRNGWVGDQHLLTTGVRVARTVP
jgi:formylglycine-generating enzyme required for sulfatase activity/serine/threonine protein kinase